MLVQLLANWIVSGCSYAFVIFGFVLIYFTVRIFHFAHGAIYLIVAMLGVLIDEFVYIPFVRGNSSLLVQMLTSSGFYIVIVNFIVMFYGNDIKVLSSGYGQLIVDAVVFKGISDEYGVKEMIKEL